MNQANFLKPALLLFASAWVISSQTVQAATPSDSLTIKTQTAAFSFNIELADTPAARKQGLMQRRKMQDDEGMLFLYPAPKIIRMWMKDTYLPLDMIFADPQGQISHIHRNAKPLSTVIITSQTPAVAVLEVPGGTTERLQIKRGDWLIHPFFTNQPSP